MKNVIARWFVTASVAVTSTAAMAESIPLNILVSGTTGKETASVQVAGSLIATTTSAASTASLASMIVVSTTSTTSTN
jgi:hypothetical protein